MEETLLDSRQVAQLLNISRSYVYYLINVGDLPCIRIRNSVRIRPRDLESFMRRRRHWRSPALARQAPPA